MFEMLKAKRRGKIHMKEKAAKPDETNHAIVRLTSKETGEVILYGCVCNAVFWRDDRQVAVESVVGDWAKPFRQELGVRARPPMRRLKG